MRRITAVTAVVVTLAAGFIAGGTWSAHRSGSAHASAHAATLYTCPMHPDYRSERPGNCPICGMPIVAKHAGGDTTAKALPHGAVQVSPERQQAIGIRLGVVSRVAGAQSLRTTGRVEPDENRVYPIVAAVSGWIRNAESVATGDAVKKDQVLASFLAPEVEFRSAQQSYFTGLEAFYRMAVTQPQPQSQSQLHASVRGEVIDRMADALRSMGVSNSQLREMGKRRELVPDIRVESPVDGVVLKRSVSPGLRFDRGFEFYRIADLNRVWILADVYRHQLPFIRRGASARIATAEKSSALSATVSQSEPIFDESTLTLKVRLEVANPRRELKPGMFVDVEFPVELPAALVVPADAIVDSGLRKTVFVDRGNGYFEPRLVETGWRAGDDVEVTKGLTAGERIVISGTFFIDSESRMKAPARVDIGRAGARSNVRDARGPQGSRQRRPYGGARRARVLLLFGQLQSAVRRRPVAPREEDGREAMIERIIDLSVRNKFLVLLLVGAAALAGAHALRNVPLDAIPDLGDTQVIIYSRWERSPDLVEAQVTYPIVTAMLGAPRVRAVRGVSDFGYSFVYVIFEDGADTYWARTRTLEYLSGVLSKLPPDSRTELGPDATGLGWVFQYALVDRSGKHSLADLRSSQDWYLRYHLKSVPGVSEVASVGGFGRQYQVAVDPNRLRNYKLSIQRVVEAVRGGNAETAGRLIEFGGTEYMVRGRGYAKSVSDFESIVVSASESGTPVRIRDIGHVTVGPDLRRGVADLDGAGEVVSGIVVMRQGENAVDVIDRVKERIRQIKPGLPSGMEIVPIYDRSVLIRGAIDNVSETLVEVVLTVVFIVLLFLWHVPSALIPLITIPVAVLVAFIPFSAMGITANIMSLGGIAIAMGELVDAAIVVVEQTHKKLEQAQRDGSTRDYHQVVLEAVREVAPASFFALLVIAVSFLPVLTLESQEGRLFKPLAYTKTLTMLVAAALVITLDPALRVLFTRVRRFEFRPAWLCRVVNAVAVGRIRPEETHPISRVLTRMYEPVVRWSLRWKWSVIGGAAALVVATIPVFMHLGSEFMPPLREGSLFYMPTTMPGISIGEAQKLVQVSDRTIKQFPEVDRVLGKAGRADTSTDPAPLSMLETVITLKPTSEWRRVETWYSGWAPEWMKRVLRHVTPDRISEEQLVEEMNAALTYPGVSNAWTMPIKGRIDMLTTGIRTPVGLKVSGADFAEIEKIGMAIEAALPAVRGTRNVFAERTGSGYFLDIEWNRDALARYGLSIETAQSVVQNAIGGENVTTTVEGRERYPVNVRYMRDFRSDTDALAQRACAGVGWTASDPARRAGAREGRDRTCDAPQRGWAAHRIRLRGRRRPRRQQLCGRG